MDDALLDGLNGAAASWPLLGDVARFLAVYGLYALAVAIAALGTYELWRRPSRAVRVALFGGIALAVSLFVLWGVGALVFEARPFVTDADTVRLVPHAADSGFPSDHATAAAALAVIGALVWRRWAVGLLVGALLVGLGRVMVGVHYPTDVIAGWVVGAAPALLLWWCWPRTGSPRRELV